MSKTEYSKGSKHGLAYKYHKDGWLLWKKRYTFGKEDGVQKYFHPSLNMANDGKNVTNTLRTRLSCEAENGKKEGIVRAWYSNGNKEYVELYTNGVKDGEQLYFDDKENLIGKENWENGKKNGTQTYYDANGNVIREEKVIRTYYTNNAKKYVERYTNGVLDGKQEYYDRNEQLIGEAQWSAGVQQSGCKLIEGLLVWFEDLGQMNWWDAMAACEAMGDGWHLPTKDELNVLYQNKDAIGVFYTSDNYWSSTDSSFKSSAYIQNFGSGKQHSQTKDSTKESAWFNPIDVRAVRTINP